MLSKLHQPRIVHVPMIGPLKCNPEIGSQNGKKTAMRCYSRHGLHAGWCLVLSRVPLVSSLVQSSAYVLGRAIKKMDAAARAAVGRWPAAMIAASRCQAFLPARKMLTLRKQEQ